MKLGLKIINLESNICRFHANAVWHVDRPVRPRREKFTRSCECGHTTPTFWLMQLFCLSFPGAHCVRGVSSEWQTATSTCAVGSAVNQDELIDQQCVLSTEKVLRLARKLQNSIVENVLMYLVLILNLIWKHQYNLCLKIKTSAMWPVDKQVNLVGKPTILQQSSRKQCHFNTNV